MNYTVGIEGIGKVDENFEKAALIAMKLKSILSKYEHIDKEAKLTVTQYTSDGFTVIEDCKLGEYITASSFYLHVNGEGIGHFDNRESLDNFLRKLVNKENYSIKTGISIIDENKQGLILDQFVGEIHHYLDDWDQDHGLIELGSESFQEMM